jgi:predicted dehydrogenase
MSDEKIRTAVVGAGKMGSIHAKVYSQLPESELVAVVDVDPSKAAQLAETYGCPAFADGAEILDRVDAVTIATPTVTHLQLAQPWPGATIRWSRWATRSGATRSSRR